MTRRPWYKRFPQDFFDGCLGLSFEERGAYALVLDLIYMHGGPIPDNDRYISGMLSLGVRSWRNLKARLVEMNKLSLSDGRISNRRADAEIAAAIEVAEKRAVSGAAGGVAKAVNAKLSGDNPEIIPTLRADNDDPNKPKCLKNKDPSLASAGPLLKDTRAGLESETEKGLVPQVSNETFGTRPNEVRTDSPKSRKRLAYPADFEEFWKGYPTDPNMSKAEALAAWQRLNADDRLAAIASLPGFLAYCERDKTYRPVHANRYLLKRRFDGHLEAAQKVSQQCSIRPEDPAWQAWRTHYRDTGKTFAVSLMDGRQRDGKSYVVPAEWPPGFKHSQAAE